MEKVRQKSWFSRNWGWVLGGGCLSMIIIVVVFVGFAVFKISDTITGSETYMHALSKATENEKVIEFLGSPIEKNGMGSTNFTYNNGTSEAKFTIPIKGPKDEGNIVVEAEKINDEWSYSELYVKVDGETEVINLLEPIIEEALDDF